MTKPTIRLVLRSACTSTQSDQPLLIAPAYPKRDKGEPLPCRVDLQADLFLLVTQVVL